MFTDCSISLLVSALQSSSCSLSDTLKQQLQTLTENVHNAVAVYEAENADVSVCEYVLRFTSQYHRVVQELETYSEHVDSTLLVNLKTFHSEITSKFESLRILAPFTSLVNQMTLIDTLIVDSISLSKQKKYFLAVQQLCKAKRESAMLRSSAVDSFLTDDVHCLLTAIELETSFLWESVSVTCKQLWNKCVSFKSELTTEKCQPLFKLAIGFGDSNVDDFINALDHMLLLRCLIFDLGDSIIHNVIEPYVRKKIENIEISDAAVIVIYGEHSISAIQFIQKLELIIYYLTVAFSKLKVKVFHKYFRNKCDEMMQLIINRIVIPEMPTSQVQLEEYRMFLDSVRTFEDSLIVNGYLESKSLSLKQLSENVKLDFSAKVFRNLLIKMRDLIKHDFYPVIDVGCCVNEDNHCLECKHELDEQFPCFEQRKVSESIVDLKNLIRETIAEYSSDDNQFQDHLSNTVRNLCELYITVFPCVYRKELSNAPEKIALFYNNCLYLAHELQSLHYDYEHQLNPTVFKDFVTVLKQIGSDYLLDCLRKQRNFSFFDLNDASKKLISNTVKTIN